MRIKKDVIKLNKKEKKIHLKEIEENGIALSYHPRENKKDKIEFLLLNALLDFLIVMGTLGVFLEAFEIKTNMPMIIMSSMVISLAMAFINANSACLNSANSFIKFIEEHHKENIKSFKYIVEINFDEEKKKYNLFSKLNF